MILISEFMDEQAVARLRESYETTYDPELADRQNDLPAMLGSVRALVVRNRTQVGGTLLAAAPDLSCIGRLGVGLDNIDLDACAAREIAVYPATGANNLSVAEYVITAALILQRGAWFANAAMIAGEWPRQSCAGCELAGKELGLIGYGAIARDTARLARGLGMSVIAHDPYLAPGDPGWAGARSCPLDELLAKAHVISLHVPLSDATRHLIGKRALGLMKPDAILINAARGGVVDETALASALGGGRIAGAALDVFETEPLSATVGAKFSGLSNLILTPHIAGVTVESNYRVSMLTADNILAHLAKG